MQVGIIGAGIAGLTVAAGLLRRNHDVTIFERSPAPAPTGAGLTLFGNAFEALDFLGIGDEIRSICTDAMTRMTSGQRRPDGSWIKQLPQAAFSTMRSVHRHTLHTRLLDCVGLENIRFGCDARVVTDGLSGIEVGGTWREFDLVIVADGIHSRNRARLGMDPGLGYAGYTAWRGVTEATIDLRGEAGETWGRGQIFGIVPLSDTKVYWFATLSTPAGGSNEDERDALVKLFSSWHPPITDCIHATPPEAILRHDIYDLARPLPRFTKGQTVLMGDAAHAMTPNLGQGAGQCIEDAATLVMYLEEAREDLSTACERYSQARTQRANAVLRRSRTAGAISQLSYPALCAVRDAVLRMTPDNVLLRASAQLHHWPDKR